MGRRGRNVLIDRDRGYAKILPALLSLDGGAATVDVGVFEDAGATPEGLPLADLAAIHEFGAPSVGIPARSFLRATLDRQEPRARRLLAEPLRRALAGDATDPAQFARMIGEGLVAQIQEAISAGVDPPNAPSTLAQKTGTTPLVDTGALRNAITWRVAPLGPEQRRGRLRRRA